MKKSRFSEEQITYALRQADVRYACVRSAVYVEILQLRACFEVLGDFLPRRKQSWGYQVAAL